MTKDKLVKLRLTFPHYCNRDEGKVKHYKVVSISNSIEFEPNQYLNKIEVDILCASDKYDITIVPKKD